MKMRMKTGIALIIAIFLLLSIGLNTLTIANRTKLNITEAIGNDELKGQDGRFIKKLEWTSPNGELPGTYEEYLEMHPLKPAHFSAPQNYESKLQFMEKYISILVDQKLYPKITQALNEYVEDLQGEGYMVILQAISGGTPEEIKEWVTDRFNAGCECFVFIGDITAAWAEVSDSVFPCDLFYMDLDGNWEDSDSDGDYEIHTSGSGDMGPEVYIGRINAHTLTYDSEENMINDYLSKAHAYRVGELTQDWGSLEYIDEDWYNMDVFMRYIYGDHVARYDFGFNTTAQDYLDKLDLGQHFVQVCAHSYSGGHHFGTRPTESASYGHVYVYSPSSRSAKLLMGCDDGIKVWLNGNNVYTKDRYGGWTQDEFEADVSLNQGWNQLLCKISQQGGDHLVSVYLTDTNYNTFDDLNYQIKDPDESGEEAEFIRSWLLNGFHQDDPDNFWYYLTTNYLGVDEDSINPTEGQVMGGKTWTTYDSGNPFINMGKYSNYADYGACYAFARVYSPATTSCQLWMGYDDGARIWLNGNEVLYDNRYGGFEADMTKINVTLQPGENRLLIKISEWMGEHGFSARLCQSDGTEVDGLTYDPAPTPITHIGTWLFNGPYYNPVQATRLSKDYLGGEENVTPNEGDPAPFGSWERGIGEGCPFNIGSYFDHGGWVLSEDIQTRDPPVLFYNLFACGPGRFTDENYLAGAYIFHTTYGLITVASSKSGSMLYFDDFTRPLSEQKTIGESFREWFDAQAPFELWEKEWYYGMVVNGDPTLFIVGSMNPTAPTINGPVSGKPRTEYDYEISSTDPDGDDLYYYVDWGDGMDTDWDGPYSSGQEIILSHKWNSRGTYNIRVRAKDVNSLLSPWSTLEVNIPRNKVVNKTFLNFLQNHQNMFPLLRQLLGL